MVGLASTSIFTSSSLPDRFEASRSRMGPNCRQGAHQSAQKSTTTGSEWERARTAASKLLSVTSIATSLPRIGFLPYDDMAISRQSCTFGSLIERGGLGLDTCAED